jgi:hypothetical protein
MAQPISRRKLLVGAAAVAVTATASASTQKPAEDPDLDHHLDEAEKLLAHPLQPDAKKLAREQLKNLRAESQSRLKFVLPENSEPCLVYLPYPGKPAR